MKKSDSLVQAVLHNNFFSNSVFGRFFQEDGDSYSRCKSTLILSNPSYSTEVEARIDRSSSSKSLWRGTFRLSVYGSGGLELWSDVEFPEMSIDSLLNSFLNVRFNGLEEDIY